MISSLKNTRPAVVLAPEVLAKSFFDPACHRVIAAWRDGAFRTAVTPSLLRYYAQLLQDLGIPERQLRRWLLWFTASEKSLMLRPTIASQQPLNQVLLETAHNGDDLPIVCLSIPEPETEAVCEDVWLNVDDFLKRLER